MNNLKGEIGCVWLFKSTDLDRPYLLRHIVLIVCSDVYQLAIKFLLPGLSSSK